jgi:hypothetical protein
LRNLQLSKPTTLQQTALQQTAFETYSFQNRQQAQPTTYNLLQPETYSFATTQMQYAASCNLNRLPLQPNCSCNRALANHQLPTALAYNAVALTATLA